MSLKYKNVNEVTIDQLNMDILIADLQSQKLIYQIRGKN